MKYTTLMAALLALLALGCEQREPPPQSETAVAAAPRPAPAPSVAADTPIQAGQDYHSFANPHQARVIHVGLDLATDFEQRILKGTATLTVKRTVPDAEYVVLDTRELDIQDVRVQDSSGEWRQTFYEVGATEGDLGAPLSIALPPDQQQINVRIRYRTSPNASGLQWLNPEQTLGKAHPFLFSQSQAIHARSWIPLQDTPAVRVTYEARIQTPPDLLAVMSAESDPETEIDGDYSFTMPQPVPSYLIAIGVGDLVFEPMSARTGVYAEPGLVDAAAWEFADTERMLEISEGLFGEYRWGRYDLLILPPSFPFGGMENPRLSFITPTVIAGDRSLVSLIAHELAHSWSGNLVTNATWRDLWLNEGFTSYLESRIMELVYGTGRARMEDTLGYQTLVNEMEELPDNVEVLAVDLRGTDPDNVFTNVPYVKGQLFLVWLEQRYGRERFDEFLSAYFDHFAFQSITTEQFLEYLQQTLLAVENPPVTMAEIREWIFEPGLPATAVIPSSDAFAKVNESRRKWLAGEIELGQIDTENWSVHEWLAFLNNMPQELSVAQLAMLDATFSLTESTNNEIAHSWLLIAIRNGYRPAYQRLEDYLVEIGRRKLMRPLYEELMRTPTGAEFARRVYQRARPGYHPLAQRTIDGIVQRDEG